MGEGRRDELYDYVTGLFFLVEFDVGGIVSSIYFVSFFFSLIIIIINIIISFFSVLEETENAGDSKKGRKDARSGIRVCKKHKYMKTSGLC